MRHEKGVSVHRIIDLFRNNRGRGIDKLKNVHYSSFAKLVKHAEGMKAAETIGIFTPDNRLCCGAVFVSSHNRLIFIFSGMNEAGKEMGAMFFLFNEFIREHAGKPLLLDFEGSNDRNLARFYKSFGSRECVYLHVRKNNLPKAIRWLKG